MDPILYREGKIRAARFMGADDDFVGPPAPADTKSSNLTAIFGGLSSIAKSVADTVVAGQLSLTKTGLNYTGIPSTIPTSQQTAVAVQPKTDYTKIALIAGIPVLGILLLSKKRR